MKYNYFGLRRKEEQEQEMMGGLECMIEEIAEEEKWQRANEDYENVFDQEDDEDDEEDDEQKQEQQYLLMDKKNDYLSYFQGWYKLNNNTKQEISSSIDASINIYCELQRIVINIKAIKKKLIHFKQQQQQQKEKDEPPRVFKFLMADHYKRLWRLE
uniref:Uncharacterized protein n=1 Tax=Glossina pallidipes TaxID=7398 RepID=A0A1A9ZK82_GLOPL